MGKLIYTAIMSLDGFIEDAAGDFSWSAPNEEVHAFANRLERPVGTHLYGRRMYEVMRYWETAPSNGDAHAIEREYAELWRAADKIVYSSSLEAAESERTTIVRSFDADEVARLKEATTTAISIGGPALAQHAFDAGLVDECHFFLNPVLIGEGKSGLPRVRTSLELVDQRTFNNGVVHLHYVVSNA